MEEAPNFIPLYAGSGTVFCVISALVLYNIVVLVGQLRDKGDEKSSGMAKAAWAISVLSLFLGPCMWLGGIIAWVMAKIERGRVYRGESSIASSAAVRIAGLNGVFAVLLFIVMLAVGVFYAI